MSFFSRRRRDVQVARDAATAVIVSKPLTDGGVSAAGGRMFKANIGHRTVRMHAILIAIVIADSPEEAGELLLRWSKGDASMHNFIREGEFILEEISPGLKGVY